MVCVCVCVCVCEVVGVDRGGKIDALGRIGTHIAKEEVAIKEK